MTTNVIIVASGSCMSAGFSAVDFMPFVSVQTALVITALIIVVMCIAYI